MRSNEENYIRRLKNRKEDALEFIVDKYLVLVKSAVYKVLSPLKRDGIIQINLLEKMPSLKNGYIK